MSKSKDKKIKAKFTLEQALKTWEGGGVEA